MKDFSFAEDVYDVVRLIPQGRVTTYGHIARYLGHTKSSRIVGWVLNKSHISESKIPAHRVVNRNGVLTGKNHFGTDNEMAHLLISEGILVNEDKIVHFEQLLWDPSTELMDLPS